VNNAIFLKNNIHAPLLNQMCVVSIFTCNHTYWFFYPIMCVMQWLCSLYQFLHASHTPAVPVMEAGTDWHSLSKFHSICSLWQGGTAEKTSTRRTYKQMQEFSAYYECTFINKFKCICSFQKMDFGCFFFFYLFYFYFQLECVWSVLEYKYRL